jgi:ribosomal protein S18 acetylase RimI-like enzyme
MTNPGPKLTEAGNEDYQLIASIASITWNKNYGAFITQAQIDYMLEWMYDEESLKEQTLKKNHRFFLISNRETTAGFLSISEDPEKKGVFFIHKFYILPDEAGLGLGSSAFQELLKMIDPSEIRLTVNRKNFKSINFYFKNGFEIEAVEDFDIGNGFFRAELAYYFFFSVPVRVYFFFSLSFLEIFTSPEISSLLILKFITTFWSLSSTKLISNS